MAAFATKNPESVPAAWTEKSSRNHNAVRVLHVINGEHYAGAERVQDLLAARLPDEGFQVSMACLKPCDFPQMMQSENITVYELAMANRFDLRPVLKLLRIVRQDDCRLLHAHSPRSLLLSGIVSLLTSIPLVYHSHSPTSRDSTARCKNTLNALIERVVMACCAAVIPVSHSLASYVRRQGTRAAKVSVVHNGVARRSARPPRQACAENWVIGTMALFRPRKGTEVLLRTIAKLKSRGMRVRLRAVGRFETPEYERQIKRLVDELDIADSVYWTGFTRDVDAELQQMDIFVLPSLFGEGLPMVVLEAMAAGVPVVASDVEGIGETVRHAQDGLIVKPGDADELTEGLRRIIAGELDWNKLRHNARRRHAERFSDAAMAAGVARVYRQVLSRQETTPGTAVARFDG